MEGIIKFILIIFLIIITVCIVIVVKKFAKIKDDIAHLKNEKRELNDFLLHFSNSLKTNDGWKHATSSICRHVAEQVGCQAVAIYQNIDGKLIADGIYGPYTLVPSKNKKLLTKKKFLEDAIRLSQFSIGDSSFIGTIAENLKGEVIRDGSLDDRFSNTLDPGSIGGVMGQVLICEGELYGIIVILNNIHNSILPFDKTQCEKLDSMTSQIVLMHQLVKSYSEMNNRERIDQELELARQIQHSLLPNSLPRWSQFSINAFTKPAKEVNGDFYDFVKIDEDRLLIVIGDACGKGIPACMLSAMTRSFIRALADKFTTLNSMLVELNDKIYSDTDDGRFITINCCLLDKKHSLLEFGRAGHTELITFVHNHIRVIYPDGTALGILPSDYVGFDTFCLGFEYGMSFLVFSDGITEAVNDEEEEYGIERLKTALFKSIENGDNSDKIIANIMSDVEEFSSDQIDDQTLILIQYD